MADGLTVLGQLDADTPWIRERGRSGEPAAGEEIGRSGEDTKSGEAGRTSTRLAVCKNSIYTLLMMVLLE